LETPATIIEEVERYMRLRHKVAIVTGAACGLGRAIVELFAQEGARVVITDIDHERGGNKRLPTSVAV